VEEWAPIFAALDLPMTSLAALSYGSRIAFLQNLSYGEIGEAARMSAAPKPWTGCRPLIETTAGFALHTGEGLPLGNVNIQFTRGGGRCWGGESRAGTPRERAERRQPTESMLFGLAYVITHFSWALGTWCNARTWSWFLYVMKPGTFVRRR